MIKKIFIFIAIVLLNIGCSKDFLDTKSTSTVDHETIFETTEAALMAVNGLHRYMYTKHSYAPDMGYATYMLWNEFLGEDLVYTKGNAQWQTSAAWSLHRNTSSRQLREIYLTFYKLIANANMIILNIDNAKGTQSEKDYIKGQALSYRAFCHFCLVQWWGERYYAGKTNSQLGIVLKVDNSLENIPRSTVEEVYDQINKDLDEAIGLLSSTKEKKSSKTDIDVHVARGLKARVLLTQGKWIEAAEMAKKVINESGAELQANTYEFKKGRGCDATNSEWIWAKIAQPEIETGSLTNFYSYISNTNISYNRNTPRAIYNLLYDKISETDVRKQLWLPEGQAAPSNTIAIPPAGNKFKWISQKFIVDYPDNTSPLYAGNLITADLAYMRLPEMILIEAEAYARSGNYSAAAEALYPLAHIRDPKYILSTNTGDELIEEIMIQRRIELWGEGFRFLDLKRLNMDLDRGPAPRAGYNQGGAGNGWKSGATPTNLDPLASNFNMYDDQKIGEANRYRAANSIEWQFVFYQSEIDRNPLIIQNPI
jgi:SusD family.